jgi:integrase
MPKLHHRTPKYGRHRATGQAVVTIDGRDIYLGRHGTTESRNRYDQLVSEWLAAGRQIAALLDGLTVDEVLARYWQFAQLHYRKHGEPTGELDNIRYALRPLEALYGESSACEFGPLALKAVRETMIAGDLSRGVINQRIGIIKRVFRWAVSEELVPVSVFQALATVAGLRRGRTGAREAPPVRPVSAADVDATLPHLPPVVGDMVRFQRLTGCRPAEVCLVRPCDVDRSAPTWAYRPASHKTEHRDRERVIFVGPQAQQVLLPYLARGPEAYCFSPAESEARRRAELRRRRKTPVQPSQVDRSVATPKRKPGCSYNKRSYAYAVQRACDRASIPRWSPNRLRHAAATLLRARYGLEAAQLVLGHARADVTQIYAERDLGRAAEIMGQVG